MSDTLARLRQAEMRRQAALQTSREEKQRVIELILAAREEGFPMTQVAEESGIGRANLYWLLGGVAGEE